MLDYFSVQCFIIVFVLWILFWKFLSRINIWFKDCFESFLKVKMEVPCLLLHNLSHSAVNVRQEKKKENKLEEQGKADNREIIVYPEYHLQKVTNLNCFTHCVHECIYLYINSRHLEDNPVRPCSSWILREHYPLTQQVSKMTDICSQSSF